MSCYEQPYEDWHVAWHEAKAFSSTALGESKPSKSRMGQLGTGSPEVAIRLVSTLETDVSRLLSTPIEDY